MILVARIVAVYREIATCVMRTLNPNLQKKMQVKDIPKLTNLLQIKSYLSQMRIAALAFSVGVGNDHVDTRQQLSGLHDRQ